MAKESKRLGDREALLLAAEIKERIEKETTEADQQVLIVDTVCGLLFARQVTLTVN